MQRLVLTALLMVMVAALSPASGQTGKSAGEQEAQRFVDAFASGLEHNDAAAVDRLLAPECWCCDEARGSGSWSPHRPVKSVRRGCLASGRGGGAQPSVLLPLNAVSACAERVVMW